MEEPNELEARVRWDTRAPTHYRFVCSTVAMVGETRVENEVRDHRVVGTTVLRDAIRRPAGNALTVEDVFDQVRASQRDAAAVEVTYDPVLAYPTSVAVDQTAGAVDDEYRFGIEDLQPA